VTSLSPHAAVQALSINFDNLQVDGTLFRYSEDAVVLKSQRT